MLTQVIKALILTISIEAFVAWIFKIRSKSAQVNLLLINCITNPLLNIAAYYVDFSIYQLVFVELVIIVVEFLMLSFLRYRPYKKYFALSFFANIASFGIGLLIFFIAKPHIYDLFIPCMLSQQPTNCTSTTLISLTKSHKNMAKQYIDDTHEYWYFFYPDTDRRILSDSIHDVGMTLAHMYTDPVQAMKACSLNWYGGCVHGIAMEYLDDNPNRSAALLETCQALSDRSISQNCIHGIGHIMWAQNKGLSLNSVLNKCPTDELQKNACASGIFMEFTKNDTSGTKTHSHHKVGSRKLPCQIVDEEFRDNCMLSEASYQNYYPEQSTENAFSYCNSIPTGLRADCYMLIKQRLDL